MNGKTTPWISGGRRNPEARCRLFCLPHSGSGASQFASWQKFLPPFLDICPIQLPGRENRYRETPFTQLHPIAKNLAMALEPYLDRPYILYGYSWGALIAFELARQLRRQKIPPPVALYTLARPAPHLPQTKDPLHQLPDDSFVQELIRRFNGMSPVILQDQELMKLLLPTLRADVTALETYVYQDEEPLDCPIRAFGGRFDSTTTEDDLRAWQLHTKSSFELEMFHGDHFFIRNHQQSIFRSIAAVSFKF
jgi:surfactin synthase thioesterase subunit